MQLSALSGRIDKISLLIKTNFLRFALRMESHYESLKNYESVVMLLEYDMHDQQNIFPGTAVLEGEFSSLSNPLAL